MDVPGLSCSPGVGICERDALIHPSLHAFPTALPFQQQRKSIDSSLPFPFYFLIAKSHLQEWELLI